MIHLNHDKREREWGESDSWHEARTALEIDIDDRGKRGERLNACIAIEIALFLADDKVENVQKLAGVLLLL